MACNASLCEFGANECTRHLRQTLERVCEVYGDGRVEVGKSFVTFGSAYEYAVATINIAVAVVGLGVKWRRHFDQSDFHQRQYKLLVPLLGAPWEALHDSFTLSTDPSKSLQTEYARATLRKLVVAATFGWPNVRGLPMGQHDRDWRMLRTMNPELRAAYDAVDEFRWPEWRLLPLAVAKVLLRSRGRLPPEIVKMILDLCGLNIPDWFYR